MMSLLLFLSDSLSINNNNLPAGEFDLDGCGSSFFYRDGGYDEYLS
jgi:hypothetical protein